MTIRVRFRKTRPDAIVPTYAHPGDSGMDLCALESVTIVPGVPQFFDTGIAIELPPGYEAQVRSRSSLTKIGIVAWLGTVDNGYRGSIGVVLTMQARANGGYDDTYCVTSGSKIAQLVIAPVAFAELEEVYGLSDSERGGRGWGSSGA